MHNTDQRSAPQGLIGIIGWRVRNAVHQRKTTPALHQLHVAVLRHYLKHGTGPDAQALVADDSNSSWLEIASGLESLNQVGAIQYDGEKVASAYPFNSRPSRHRVTLPEGRTCYAMCATDAMGIHFMSGLDISVISNCPGCEAEILYRLVNGVLREIDPASALQCIALPNQSGSVAETACPNMNLYCEAGHIDKTHFTDDSDWQTETHTAYEVARHAQWLFSDFMSLD